MIRVVYVAGPYRAPTPEAEAVNIERARWAAREVWRRGFVALCPHLNCPDDIPRAVALSGDLELLRRCDAVLLLDGWENSEGSVGERFEAISKGLPVFRSLCLLGEAER